MHTISSPRVQRPALIQKCQPHNFSVFMDRFLPLAPLPHASLPPRLLCPQVLEKEGIPLHQQRLIFNQKILEDNKAASDCGFGKDAVVVLELMTDAEAHDQVQAECTNLGKGIWQVDFPVRGYGQYCLQLKIGSAAVVKDIHRFSLEPPLDEPKGKAAQQKFLDEMQREIDDLKGKLGMTVVTKREEAADGTLSPAELSPDEG